MLLMSGLMLADKTAGMEEQLVAAKERIAALEAEASQMPAPEPERVEVPVIPQIVTDSFAELAARAEALAAEVEEMASA
jgi:cell division protein ZapA